VSKGVRGNPFLKKNQEAKIPLDCLFKAQFVRLFLQKLFSSQILARLRKFLYFLPLLLVVSLMLFCYFIFSPFSLFPFLFIFFRSAASPRVGRAGIFRFKTKMDSVFCSRLW
jgi:hypothetical protein